MDEWINRYSEPMVLIPIAAMFVIIFGIVRRSLQEMPLFEGGTKNIVALCVSTLAMYGMDQTLVSAVLTEYTAMGIVMLFGLAGLLLAAWIGLMVKTRKHIRRSQWDDEEDPE